MFIESSNKFRPPETLFKRFLPNLSELSKGLMFRANKAANKLFSHINITHYSCSYDNDGLQSFSSMYEFSKAISKDAAIT